jgi:hypothetical protein
MSAYLGFAYPDRIELLTDGASTDNEGRLSGTHTKVWPAHGVPFAVTGAGNLETVENIALYLRGWAVVSGVDGALDALQAMPHPDDDLSIVVAAVSEANGPGLWTYSTRGARAVTRADGFVAMGSGLGADGLASLGLTSADFRHGIAEGGLKIMEAWRSKPCVSPTRPDLPAGHYIGGHVDHTVVAASGVETRQVHRWPDVVGERIRP